MTQFTVTLELTGHTTIKVDAIDVLEARETAQEKYQFELLAGDDIEEVMPIAVLDENDDEVWRI